MTVFYVLIRTTENHEFDKIRTAGVTGNATNYKYRQGDNPTCSTRDEISQPSGPISPRAATVPTNVWTRGATISIVPTAFKINTNFMATLLPGNN